jgi:hypothetical protein
MLAVVVLEPIVLINKDGHVVVFPGFNLRPSVAAEDLASKQRSPYISSVSNDSRRGELNGLCKAR